MTELSQLPSHEEIALILGLEHPFPNGELLESTLLHPLQHFLSTGGKRFRTQMIETGFLFAGGQLDDHFQKKITRCAKIIEGIHAGSMIIDDVQDHSEIRRGKPTFHRQHGISVAINAGNWLYFWALDQIQFLELEPHCELALQRYFNRILLRAHFGQAVDVGISMRLLKREEVAPVCLASMELKTGALMSLSFDMGVYLAGKSPTQFTEGTEFSRRFGIALQMFDDIGNFSCPPPKGKEDLRNGRPSFIWSVASQISNEIDYRRFVHATEMLPDESYLTAWVGLFDLIDQAQNRAQHFLEKALVRFSCTDEIRFKINQLCSQLEKSYV